MARRALDPLSRSEQKHNSTQLSDGLQRLRTPPALVQLTRRLTSPVDFKVARRVVTSGRRGGLTWGSSSLPCKSSWAVCSQARSSSLRAGARVGSCPSASPWSRGWASRGPCCTARTSVLPRTCTRLTPCCGLDAQALRSPYVSPGGIDTSGRHAGCTPSGRESPGRSSAPPGTPSPHWGLDNTCPAHARRRCSVDIEICRHAPAFSNAGLGTLDVATRGCRDSPMRGTGAGIDWVCTPLTPMDHAWV